MFACLIGFSALLAAVDLLENWTLSLLFTAWTGIFVLLVVIKTEW